MFPALTPGEGDADSAKMQLNVRQRCLVDKVLRLCLAFLSLPGTEAAPSLLQTSPSFHLAPVWMGSLFLHPEVHLRQ